MKATALLALATMVALAPPAASAARVGSSPESTIRSGIYSDSTCSDPGFLWIYVPDITIDIDRGGADDSVSIGTLVPESERLVHGWQRFRGVYAKDETFEYFLRMATDERVELLWWDSGPAKVSEPPRVVWPQALPSGDPEAGDHWRVESYARCDTIPFPLSLLHGEPAAFLFSLEPVIRSCRSGHGSCIDEAFAAVDIHPDGALSTAEWARLIRVTLYFILAYGEKSKAETLGATYAVSVLAAPLAAAAIVSSYDYDGDGKTSLEEVLHAIMEQDTGAVPGIEGLDPETRSKLEQAITILRGLSKQVPGIE